MNTNNELAMQHLISEFCVLRRAAPWTCERALYFGVMLGAVSAYRNLGILGEDDLKIVANELADEGEKLPILRGHS